MSAVSFIQPHIIIGDLPNPEQPRPLRGFPAGRVRLRLRLGDLGHAFVRVPGGIRHFLVHEKDGYWEPFMEQEANLTPSPSPSET